jgi:hypothetical protein
MLDRRLQVLIDEERWGRLQDEADRRQVSVSTLVRRAIDTTYPSDTERRRRAGEALLAAEPMSVPDDVEELRRELDDDRAARFE